MSGAAERLTLYHLRYHLGGEGGFPEAADRVEIYNSPAFVKTH